MQTERQQEIIQVALELINEKGIQGLTIKNISKKIGISEPAIYRHFESKIHILTSILDLLKENNSRFFDNELKYEGLAMEKIEHVFMNHFKTFINMPAMTSVVFSEEIFRNEALLTKKISEVIEHNNQALISIIFEGQKKNEFRTDIDADKLAVMIMGTLRIFIRKWQFSEFSFDLMKEGKVIIQMIKLLITKQ